MCRHIVIVGLGLIGGSLAKALHGFEDFDLIGVDVSQPTLRYALEHDIVDRAELDPVRALSQGDLVFLCLHPRGIVEFMSAHRDHFKPGAMITDVCGIKGAILEGAKVLACVELQPYSGGLQRNITQCLEDFGIPLYLSHTVTDIRGRDRVEQVVVSQVDEKRNPIPGTEMVFDCDTLLLSVGLIPENELTRQAGVEMDRRTNGAVVYENMETSIPGVFACGNVCHVHDLVDFVTGESQRAGAAAARYVLEGGQTSREEPVLKVKNGDGVTYTVPQRIRPGRVEKRCDLFFRVNRICGDSEIVVTSGDTQIARFKREHLAPGEMENIALPRVLLDRAKDELTVSIREVEQA